MNVIKYTALLSLSQKNYQVTQEQLKQAQARLADVDAQVIHSLGGLDSSKAEFEKTIIHKANYLIYPKSIVNLPESLQESLTLGKQQFPLVLVSKFLH